MDETVGMKKDDRKNYFDNFINKLRKFSKLSLNKLIQNFKYFSIQ